MVKLGLESMSRTENIGLKALLRQARIESQELSAYHCGYVIGPRINAAGRLASAIEVVRLFATESEEKAREIARDLDELNRQRQEMTIQTISSAIKQVENQKEEKLLFVYAKDWHEGIIGLVAGKLAETFNKPAVAATIVKGKVTASARSNNKYNITEAIAVYSSYLTRFGGHAQAAGLSLEEDNLELFKQALQKFAAENIDSKDMVPLIEFDAELKPSDINLEIAKWIDKFEPFGLGNPKPSFLLKNVQILQKHVIGREQKHIRLILSMGNDNRKIEAVHFNAAERYEKISTGDKIDIITSLELNVWNGNTKLQLKIKDIE